MIADIVRAIVQRIMHDKLLMGLVIICILGIFFTGAGKDESGHRGRGPKLEQVESNAAKGQHVPGESQNPPPAQGGQTQGQAAQGQAQEQGDKLTPALAEKFVRWWLTVGMDYKQASAAASHKEAFAWALPEPAQAFEQLFWGDHIKQGIASGTIAADFQPSSVIPLAINPDGSVVVTVVGTLVMQQTGQPPASQQLTMDFLVKKVDTGCRIAGFFNKAAIPVQ